MRISAVETVTWGEINEGRALRVEQRASSVSALMFLALLTPAIIAAVLPVVAIGTLLASDPAAQSVFGEHIGSMFLIALGFGVIATLLGLPAWRYLGRLGARRTVDFIDGRVRVFDRSMLGSHVWSCHLSEFVGLAENVRTTLSGARHELILVHRDRSKCILLQFSASGVGCDRSYFVEVLQDRGLVLHARTPSVALSSSEIEQSVISAPLAA